MNSLSWLLYLSDALPQLGGLFVAAAVILIIAALISFILFAASEGELKTIPVGVRFLIGGTLAAFLAVVVPSKQTILLIAASEMGEAVVKTPEAQEVFADLKTILKQQLDALKK